eukprot:5768846-Alexandrium_andersonii.AAC.1
MHETTAQLPSQSSEQPIMLERPAQLPSQSPGQPSTGVPELHPPEQPESAQPEQPDDAGRSKSAPVAA